MQSYDRRKITQKHHSRLILALSLIFLAIVLSSFRMEESSVSAVFTYGSLLNQRVVRAVLGRVPVRKDATLRGYTRHSIKGKCYPAIVANGSSDAVVHGKILLDVTPEELAKLDRFEDPEYERASEMVSVPEDGDKLVSSRVWVRSEANQADLEGSWDYDKFVREDLDWYVEKCRAWAICDSDV